MPASSFQQQKLRVCEVCSAYLGLHDNDRRLADHFGGKLHLGFIEIREKLDKLRVSFGEILEPLSYSNAYIRTCMHAVSTCQSHISEWMHQDVDNVKTTCCHTTEQQNGVEIGLKWL